MIDKIVLRFGTPIIALCVLFALFMGIQKPNEAKGELYSAGCQVTTASVMTIGNQSSTLVVATSSNRASLHIQQPVNATNTVHLRFSYASATVATASWVLEHVSATGTVKEAYIGKNTNYPYTGPITAVSSTGSTTILVTECLY